ncbi:MAG: hypothetical protein ACETV1_08035 [Candidatus Bathyarchaeia archaeon]
MITVYFASFDNTTSANTIIAEPVINGETATLNPSPFPNFKVSEITKATSGLGDNP